MFKYKVYECFKTHTLQAAREYIRFLVDTSNADSELTPELYEYLQKPLDTQLPSQIKESALLQFDSNFEGGNLDSAYLVSQNEYNLLLKADTNTRGHMHWFHFKVLNWRPNQTAVFTIHGLCRDLSSFYGRGMNILTRVESANGAFKTEWSVDPKVTQILEVQRASKIVRKFRKDDPKVPAAYYSSLKFKCVFPALKKLNPTASDVTQQAPGVVFSFAYALPYVYSDLMRDLVTTQKYLLDAGGIIKKRAPQTILQLKPT